MCVSVRYTIHDRYIYIYMRSIQYIMNVYLFLCLILDKKGWHSEAESKSGTSIEGRPTTDGSVVETTPVTPVLLGKNVTK